MFVNIKAPRRRFPFLKGKANELRHFGPGPLHVRRRLLGDTVAERQITLALRASVHMETILDETKEEYRLTGEAADEYERAAQAFLTCASALAADFHSRHRMLFNVTIKFHYLAEHARMCRWLHPRKGRCYQGEDMMLKTRNLVQSCIRGTPGHLVCAKVLGKYSLGMHLKMKGQHEVFAS